MKNIILQTRIIEDLAVRHNIKLSYIDGEGNCYSSRSKNKIRIDRTQFHNAKTKPELNLYFIDCEYNFDWFIVHSFLHELGHQKQRQNWSQEKKENCWREVRMCTEPQNYRKCYSENTANRYARRHLQKVIKDFIK